MARARAADETPSDSPCRGRMVSTARPCWGGGWLLRLAEFGVDEGELGGGEGAAGHGGEKFSKYKSLKGIISRQKAQS